MNQGTDSRLICLPNILSVWTNNVANFPKVTQIMSLLICHFKFLIFVPKTF